jgi:hypothetical protein
MKKTSCVGVALWALALAAVHQLGTPLVDASGAMAALAASACIGIALLLRGMVPGMHVGLVLGLAGGWAAMLLGIGIATDASGTSTPICMTAALAATTWILIGYDRYRTPLPPLLCFFGLLAGLKALDAGMLHGNAVVAGGIAALLLSCAAALKTPVGQAT